MFNVTIKKIETTNPVGSGLRSDEVEGITPYLPKVGQRFFMYSGNTLTPETDLRYIHTTAISEVTTDHERNEIVFKTENSTYVLHNIKPATVG